MFSQGATPITDHILGIGAYFFSQPILLAYLVFHLLACDITINNNLAHMMF